MSNDERRRQRALRARKRRRRQRLLLAAVVTVLLLIVGVILSLTVFFHIESIAVAGDEIYDPEQIIEASGITVGENLFLLSKKDAAAAIEQALPYVETAEIKRSLSCTVTIQITAAKAVGALDNGEYYTLLSSAGKALENGVVSLPDGVFVVKAGEVKRADPGEYVTFAQENAFEDLVHTFDAFAAANFSDVTELDVRDRTNIKARYKDRINLELGEVSSLPDKMSFVTATLERCETNTPNFKGTIDFTIDKKAYQNAETSTKAPKESETASQKPAQTNAASANTTPEA